MTPAPRAVASLAAAATVGASVVVGLLAAPAHAALAPLDDRAAVYASGTYRLDVLANDEVTPSGSGDLTLCGVSGVDPQRLYVDVVGEELRVEVSDRFAGTTQFTYDACQGDSRESATVVLSVSRLVDVTAAKPPRTRGKVRFTNSNTVPVRVLWGGASGGRPDASRTVGARQTVTISTRRSAIFWIAQHLDGAVPIDTGDGTVRRLRSFR